MPMGFNSPHREALALSSGNCSKNPRVVWRISGADCSNAAAFWMLSLTRPRPSIANWDQRIRADWSNISHPFAKSKFVPSALTNGSMYHDRQSTQVWHHNSIAMSLWNGWENTCGRCMTFLSWRFKPISRVSPRSAPETKGPDRLFRKSASNRIDTLCRITMATPNCLPT